MQTVTAPFTTKQKSAELATCKYIILGSTDITSYLIKGGMSNISIDLERELNAFKLNDVTLTCSNHDETFFESGGSPSGLFDDLSAEIPISIRLGILGVTDFVGPPPTNVCTFNMLVDKDTIKRIRDNRVQFTCHSYGKQLENMQWTAGTPSNKAVYEVVNQICTDASLTMSWDVDPIPVTDMIIYNYLGGTGSASTAIIDVVIDEDNNTGNSRKVGVLYNLGSIYWLYYMTVNIMTGVLDSWTVLNSEGVGRWQNLWYYNGAFWVTKDTGDGTEVTDIVTVTTGGSKTEYDITDGAWNREAEWFSAKGQYIYFAEENASDEVRIKRFDMSETPPAVDHTSGNQSTYHVWSRPVYETEASKVWVAMDDTGDGFVWASYHIGTTIWDTTNTWDSSLASAFNDDVGVYGDPSNALIYFPAKYYDVGGDTWSTLSAAIDHIKKSPATGGLWAFRTSDGELVELGSAANPEIPTDRNAQRRSTGAENYPPPESEADIMIGIWQEGGGPIPVVARPGIIPFCCTDDFETDSLRDILENLAATFLCTVEIDKDYIYFWSRNTYRDAFSLTKDLYAEATQTQWDNWCDGLRLNVKTNQYEQGSTGTDKKVIEIDTHYLDTEQAFLGMPLASVQYAFYGSKRRMFEVDGVYLIQLELFDRVTLSWLSGTVVTHLHSLHYDDRTKLTRLKLLEEV